MSASGIGSRRLVVGARYGIGAWLGQRLTALWMAIYIVGLTAYVLVKGDFSYVGWAEIFSPLWVKVLSLFAIWALLYHAWVGVRDIWMDYIQLASLRLSLHVLTVLWLVACAVWSVQILWSV